MADDPNAVAFLTDAKRHCKAVGFSGVPGLSKKTGLLTEAGVVDVTENSGLKAFITAGRTGRFWEREAEQ